MFLRVILSHKYNRETKLFCKFEKTKLQKVYGFLQNQIRGNKDLGDWDSLSLTQQEGLTKAISDIESGYGISHDEIIEKYRKNGRQMFPSSF